MQLSHVKRGLASVRLRKNFLDVTKGIRSGGSPVKFLQVRLEGNKDALQYAPEFFFRESIATAKEVILTPGDELNTDERWEKETKWLMEQIKFNDDIGLVIDFGCGIGRLSKEIKNPVLGVDISQSMRVHSEIYVKKLEFSCVRPETLQILSANGLRADGVVSAWALQHVLYVIETIHLLMEILKPRGVFWLLDTLQRHVPCRWPSDYLDSKPSDYSKFVMFDDEVNILKVIEEWCDLEEEYPIPINLAQRADTKLRKYRRKAI